LAPGDGSIDPAGVGVVTGGGEGGVVGIAWIPPAPAGGDSPVGPDGGTCGTLFA